MLPIAPIKGTRFPPLNDFFLFKGTSVRRYLGHLLLTPKAARRDPEPVKMAGVFWRPGEGTTRTRRWAKIEGGAVTLPETNSKSLPGKGDSYWKPQFLGAMLVLGSLRMKNCHLVEPEKLLPILRIKSSLETWFSWILRCLHRHSKLRNILNNHLE